MLLLGVVQDIEDSDLEIILILRPESPLLCDEKFLEIVVSHAARLVLLIVILVFAVNR